MKSFPEQLADAQTALRARLHNGSKGQSQDRKIVLELYQAGYAVGLTSKEITQVLLKAVVPDLRPKLTRS